MQHPYPFPFAAGWRRMISTQALTMERPSKESARRAIRRLVLSSRIASYFQSVETLPQRDRLPTDLPLIAVQQVTSNLKLSTMRSQLPVPPRSIRDVMLPVPLFHD